MNDSRMNNSGKSRWSAPIPAQVIIFVLLLIIGLACFVFAVSGAWPSIVAVESSSMSPNLNVGDMVFLVQKDKAGGIVTGDEAREAGVMTFGGYGDVIVYTPNGNSQTTALIHRAVSWINKSDAIDKYGFDPDTTTDGYVTKGDNNDAEDQTYAFAGVGRVYPVKEEWIIGKASFAIPFLGYFMLHIWQVAAVILVILLVYEIYYQLMEKREERERREKERK